MNTGRGTTVNLVFSVPVRTGEPFTQKTTSRKIGGQNQPKYLLMLSQSVA